jgi:hypothetical protein
MSVAPEELVATARDGWLANPNLPVPRRDPLVLPRSGNTSDPGGSVLCGNLTECPSQVKSQFRVLTNERGL